MDYAMNTNAILRDWVGRVIDERFTLLEWLGGSERSGVFLTELQGPQSQKVAIKLIPADIRDEEVQIGDWALIKTLSHPHLMRLFHTGRCQIATVKMLYAVTEYAEEVLSQVLPDRPLTPTETSEMLEPVLDTLSYLHGKGFVHGRLKPSNILVVGDQLKLSCDNLRVVGDLDKNLPALNIYNAPEGGVVPISPAADVWSLGVTLVEALTQHPPVWDRSTHAEPIVPESVPQPFAGIARECLHPDPERRCTVNDVKARLKPAPEVPVPASRTRTTATAKPRVRALVAVALVLLAVVAGLWLRSHLSGASQQAGDQRPDATQSSTAAVQGAVAKQVLPDVPAYASATIRGTFQVSVRVTVAPDGNVLNAALDSPAVSRYFANLSLQAARNWKFKPAQVDGRLVSSVWVLRFQFSQAATRVTFVETSPYPSLADK
jgi:TonB family protein